LLITKSYDFPPLKSIESLIHFFAGDTAPLSGTFHPMQLRPAKPADLPGIIEIDAAVESLRYLHIDRSGEGLSLQWKIEDRPLRERLITTFALDDDRQFAYRQITTGIDEGIAQAAEHDDQIVAALLAQAQGDVLKLIDLRVDFDHRREGLATAMIFQLMANGRELKLRAVMAESQANNDPANQLLSKLGFEIAGLDSQRHSNHDLVKEAVTLFWYFSLD
jgi:ribosomal protein S18 acetylase RimI-like enzyme